MENSNVQDKPNICGLHGQAQLQIERVKKIIIDDLGIEPETRTQALQMLDEAYTIIETAIERGTAMERRLKEYRDAILTLGFARR